MPYKTNSDLPERVKDNLPEHAKDIYRKAFNNAWEQYENPSKRQGHKTREETAHSVAWAAVEKEYAKKGDRWVAKRETAEKKRA